ncbi:universal stress protein [Streptomyces flavofungini]|uniref:Universal stress protein n=1 Tax=Streptomyces flavofungini TaxID=68200 RepID=A0ABS0XFB9_9ACTN|nr:universal stress protein [Streptomyces flavofungini]MBJ3811902.1 universal stress protein [Streptomyces flavofungini]GHC52597.1 universal stress protein [Streptomyces flavofungini]
MRQSVIVGVDRSTRSRAAADWAALEALRRGHVLKVVHVSPLSADELAGLWPYRQVPLPAPVVAELAGRHPRLRVEGVRLSGPVVPTLLGEAASAGLVVLGTRGAGGFAGLTLGAMSLAVAEACTRPVVLVPSGLASNHTGPRPDKVTLGVDARDPDDAAIDFAFDAARRKKARLHVVHAWALSSPAADRMPSALPEKDRAQWRDREAQLLSDALRPWHDKYLDVPVLKDVVPHSPAEALVRASLRAELLVVGRRGGTLGSAVDALAHHTRCPLAVVPG